MYVSRVTSKSAALREILRHRAALAALEPHRDGRLYKSFETFVIAYGKNFESVKLDEAERLQLHELLRVHRDVWARRFSYKLCFTNSQELIDLDPTSSLVFVEGFVWAYGDNFPPVHHGWLSLHGKVIDLTAPTRASARNLPPEPPQIHGEFEGRAYLGVPFLSRYVRERARANKGWRSLLDDEKSGFRLLVDGGDGAVRGLRKSK